MAGENTQQVVPSLLSLGQLRISDWFKVGKSLGFKQHDLNRIKDNHKMWRDQPRGCQMATFGKWLKVHPSPTVEHVIVALRDAGEGRAADELSRKYGVSSTEQHTFVGLQDESKKPTIGNVSIVTSGPEKCGKNKIFEIADDISSNYTSPKRLEPMRKHHRLLRQKKWLEFLMLADLNEYEPPKSTIFHNTLDMGELPAVIEMASILLKAPMFHFICFNLSQGTTAPMQIASKQEVDQKLTQKPKSTFLHFIYRIIETVTTLWVHEPDRPVKHCHTTAIVGVYSGETNCQEMMKKADTDLKEIVKACHTDKAVRYCHHQDRQMIFPLDLQDESFDDTRVKEVLKQQMRKTMTICSLDSNAYDFVGLLRYNASVLSFSECKYVARLCGIADNDVINVLKKVHGRMGLILHFQEVSRMKDLVICHPSKLIDPLEVFTNTVLKGTLRCPRDAVDVGKTGEIPYSLIDELLSGEEFAEDISIYCLLALLKYYKFLSEVECADGRRVYFMPNLLEPCTVLPNNQYAQKRKIASILFCFQHAPHSSLFIALIAELARKWKLTNNTRYKNYVTFIADSIFLTEVELCNRGDHFQLVVLQPDPRALDQSPELYTQIRHEVQHALHLVKVRYDHLSSENCRIGFYCPHCLRNSHKPLHYAVVNIVANVAHLQCINHNCNYKGQVQNEKKIKMWFTGEHPLNEKSVDGFADMMASTSLSSDIDEEDIVQKIEDHIVEEGSIPLRVVRCGLYGAPGVGKTSSVKRLTNQIVNLQGELTPQPSSGLEAPITVSLYNRPPQQLHVPVLIADDQEWSCQNLDEQLQTILQCIINPDDDPLPDQPSPGTPLADSNSISSPAAQETGNFHSIISPDEPNPLVTARIPSSLTPENTSDTIPSPAIYSSAQTSAKPLPPPKKFDSHYIRNLIKNKKWREMRSLLEFQDVTLLNIVDTGGQPEYQDILPVLLGGSGLSLLFFNLAHELEKPYKVVYREQPDVEVEGTNSIEYESQFTILQTLFQVLATLTSTCTDHAAILVGTHKDKMALEIEDIEAKLLKALHETEFLQKDVIKSFPVDKKRRNIFPLNNLSGSKDEIHQLQKIIRDVARQLPQEKMRLPTSWLLFHLALRYKYEKPGYCTLKECEQLAAYCGIQKENVPEILLYFYRHFGTILYFPDVQCMANTVICNPSVIFTSINSLVVESFNSNASPNTARIIRETGEIPHFVFRKILKSDTAGGKVLRTQQIITLLKHLNIITEITTELNEKSYFMPCLLYYCDVENTSLEVLQAKNPAPLFIHFHHGYVPMGFFTVLIIGLADEWGLESKRFKNQVSFITNRASIHRCVITLHLNYLQVDVEAKETKKLNEVCVTIRQTLLRVIGAMGKKHAYLESVKPQLRLLCPYATNQDTKQFAICHELESPEKMICRNPACTENRTHDLLAKHKIWFSSFKQDDCTEERTVKETVAQPDASSTRANYDSPHITRSHSANSIHQEESVIAASRIDPSSPKLTSDAPTLLKLNMMKGADNKPLNIIQVISAKDYMTFGTCLLQDDNGTAVDLIKKDHIQDGASNVTRAILQRWLTGTTAPHTYQHLIECLRLTDGLDGLAELIEKTLTS